MLLFAVYVLRHKMLHCSLRGLNRFTLKCSFGLTFLKCIVKSFISSFPTGAVVFCRASWYIRRSQSDIVVGVIWHGLWLWLMKEVWVEWDVKCGCGYLTWAVVVVDEGGMGGMRREVWLWLFDVSCGCGWWRRYGWNEWTVLSDECKVYFIDVRLFPVSLSQVMSVQFMSVSQHVCYCEIFIEGLFCVSV